MVSTSTLALRLGGRLLRVLGIDSPSFSMPPTIEARAVFCAKNGRRYKVLTVEGYSPGCPQS
jgi:hypothetical protein